MQTDTYLERVRIWRSSFGEGVDIHEERNVFSREKFGTDVPTPLFPAALPLPRVPEDPQQAMRDCGMRIRRS
jgi:hypothetical protein